MHHLYPASDHEWPEGPWQASRKAGRQAGRSWIVSRQLRKARRLSGLEFHINKIPIQFTTGLKLDKGLQGRKGAECCDY